MTFEGVLSGKQIDILSTEYIVLLTPSIIGSFSVMVVSIVRWRHLSKQGHLLVQLALADLLAAVVLLYSSAINKVSSDQRVSICQYILPLSMTFYLISFLLVLVYAWKSKGAIQGWRAAPPGHENQISKAAVSAPVYAIVWLIPIAIYAGYVFTPLIKPSVVIPDSDPSLTGYIRNGSKYCTSCILFLHISSDSCSDAEIIHDMLIRVFLFLVVIPVMLSCSVIYYKVGQWYETHKQEGLFPVEGDGRSRRRFKTVFSTARNMMMVILFCWTPVLVLVLLSNFMLWLKIEHHLFALYFIQAATVSLQGFLNSMVYAWRRRNFTEAILGENTPLLVYDRLAFFEQSLTSSW
ncbi:transmembrane protein 116 isoform X1 [Takifugu flavidus]|uniref:transmembrane protein 116 isoform X1 n=2 Tax=Takifugu flavidus TaxID=433684 RepID=UPI0025444E9D|nr:transmembrane protein 116 isoform X1 [Takifugu flavidus]